MARTRMLPVLRHYRALFEVGSFCGVSDGELLARFVTREENRPSWRLRCSSSGTLRPSAHLPSDCRQRTRRRGCFSGDFSRSRHQGRPADRPWTLGPLAGFAVARRISRDGQGRALARAARELRAARLARNESSLGPTHRDDDASVLHEEIDRLPERYRLPLLLCDLESQSHQEAARRLGWPLGTVKSRQARGRQRLGVQASIGAASRVARSASDRFRFQFFASVPASFIQATARAARAPFLAGRQPRRSRLPFRLLSQLL